MLLKLILRRLIGGREEIVFLFFKLDKYNEIVVFFIFDFCVILVLFMKRNFGVFSYCLYKVKFF